MTGRFPAGSGGVGLTVGVSQGRRGAPVESDIENPIRKTLHGRTLEATVFSETRMLVTGGDGARLWLSPALERMFLWGGEMAVPQDLPPEEMMERIEALSDEEKMKLATDSDFLAKMMCASTCGMQDAGCPQK